MIGLDQKLVDHIAVFPPLFQNQIFAPVLKR
jgi:hypothetical protein